MSCGAILQSRFSQMHWLPHRDVFWFTWNSIVHFLSDGDLLDREANDMHTLCCWDVYEQHWIIIVCVMSWWSIL